MLRRLKDSELDGKVSTTSDSILDLHADGTCLPSYALQPILNLVELTDDTEFLQFSPEERELYNVAQCVSCPALARLYMLNHPVFVVVEILSRPPSGSI
jgi:hypothetical protein